MLQVIPTLSSLCLSLSLDSLPFEEDGSPNILGSIAKLSRAIKLIPQATFQSPYDVLPKVTYQSAQCFKKVWIPMTYSPEDSYRDYFLKTEIWIV